MPRHIPEAGRAWALVSVLALAAAPSLQIKFSDANSRMACG